MAGRIYASKVVKGSKIGTEGIENVYVSIYNNKPYIAIAFRLTKFAILM